tara:strand:- start:10406 stop:11620 length:1215 start_codon:yes stop_codon:yes gene_type:complete
MPSYTTNLNLAKPTVGGDTNQWGGYLNTNTDTLDGIFNGAGTGTSVGLQVGSGKTLKVGGTLTATGVVQLTGSQNELRFFEAIGGADNYVALKAPNEMSGNNNYSLVLPAAQGTAGQFLKLSSLSGSEGLLQFADAGGQADNYFASSGLLNKDLGVGLHLKIADTGASVSSNADELVIENTSDAGLSILTANDAGGYVKFGDPQDDNAGEIAYTHDDNNLTFSSGGVINFKTNNTNRMSIASDGDLNFASGQLQLLADNSAATTTAKWDRGAGQGGNTSIALQFCHGGSVKGSIGYNDGSTSYNTSSDYRLKENEVAISDGITRLKTLKPYRFNFKTNPDKTVDGFFAHEVTAVPEAITGEKDGEEMQGIDQSKLVPLITAALQEAITKIESLESEIDQLKGVN